MADDSIAHVDVYAVATFVKASSAIIVVVGVIFAFTGMSQWALLSIGAGISSYLLAGIAVIFVDIENHIRSIRNGIPKATIAPTPPQPSPSSQIKA